MNLVRNSWTTDDITEFQQYLLTLSKGQDKGEWEQRIVNTALPCIAVPSTEVDRIVSTIAKGNYMQFVDLWIWQYHTNTLINGKLISRIKDFATQSKYLYKYSRMADNWSTTDSLKLRVTDKNRNNFLNFALELIDDDYTFTRRLGVTLLIIVLHQSTINAVIDAIRKLKNENEYYVNMAIAWLVAECFIKFRQETLPLFDNDALSTFVNNKAISKCRDSYRVTEEDKQMLLRYRKK